MQVMNVSGGRRESAGTPRTDRGGAEVLGALAPSQQQRLLRRDPREYARLVQHVARYGICLLDLEGRILSWNAGAENLTGYRHGELLGLHRSVLLDEGAEPGQALRPLTLARHEGHWHGEELRRRRQGPPFHAAASLDPLRDEHGALSGFVEVFHDISAQKQREARLEQQATRDALTQALNRGRFWEIAEQEIERARRFADPLSLILLDLDHFKAINDHHGHEAGDQALVLLVNTLRTELRRIDSLGRVGGDEFAILLPRADRGPACETAERLRHRIMGAALERSGTRLPLRASLGVASLRPTTRDLRELMRQADAALYQAKREGRNCVQRWFE